MENSGSLENAGKSYGNGWMVLAEFRWGGGGATALPGAVWDVCFAGNTLFMGCGDLWPGKCRKSGVGLDKAPRSFVSARDNTP